MNPPREVWVVVNGAGEIVESYPYKWAAEKAEAKYWAPSWCAPHTIVRYVIAEENDDAKV